MFKKILKITGWVFLCGFLIFTLAFTTEKGSDIKCDEIEVFYDGQQAISIGNDEIINIIKTADNKIPGKNLNKINAENIELEIEKNRTIEKAEVYKTLAAKNTRYKGILTVKIKHREPVLRVMSGQEDYFLDKYSVQIPASTKYTADVLVATGEIQPEFASEKLLPLVSYIENDPFWNAQIEQIFVLNNQELVLTPLVGDHFIEFGTTDGFQEKLTNLKVFYEKVMVQNNWSKYKSISIKYKNQVIGTKR